MCYGSWRCSGGGRRVYGIGVLPQMMRTRLTRTDRPDRCLEEGWQGTSVGRRLYLANVSLRSSAARNSQGPMDRPHFFFSFELSYPARPLKRRLGGLPRLVVRPSKIPLAVPAFTVQNDRAWSCVAHRAATTDRAEIGRIRRQTVNWLPLRDSDSRLRSRESLPGIPGRPSVQVRLLCDSAVLNWISPLSL
jgi:hypothetical protein